MIRFVSAPEYLQNFSFKVGQGFDGGFHFIEFNLVAEITDIVQAQPYVDAIESGNKEITCIGQICELMGGYFDIQKRNMFIIYRLGLPVKVEVRREFERIDLGKQQRVIDTLNTFNIDQTTLSAYDSDS